jgi:hypothetical protein
VREREAVGTDRHDPAHRAPAGPRRGRRSFLVGGGALIAAAGVRWALPDGAPAPIGPNLRPVAAEGTSAAWNGGTAWDWREFREVPVSFTDNKVRLTSRRGVGSALGVGGPSGNDRRIYVRRDLEATDIEMSAEFSTVDQAQFGLAMRVQPGVAVVVWQNIYRIANANLLQGTWQFGDDRLAATNVGAAVLGFIQPVERAVGDGSRVVVTTPSAHRLRPGDLVLHGGELARFGTVAIEDTPSLISYTFPSTAVGSWTAGEVQRISIRDRRRVAARLVGDEVSFTQWLPGEPQPAWDDDVRVVTRSLPAELAQGGAPPSGRGGVGVVLAHLGDGDSVDVTALRIRVIG